MTNSTSDPAIKDASLAGLYDTLLPVFVMAVIYVGIFLLLRKSNRRFYAPRSYLGSLREEERSVALPTGWFNWIGPFWKIPDTYALQHQSLDAYLFLRFLRMLVVITFFGACMTWPILFPIYATGGKGNVQLNILSMSNINGDGAGKYKYLATCFVGWLFFGFVLMVVTRESIFYINLRQAFLLSPIYANRISARTVLFTSVPEEYRNEAKLRQVFGAAVRRVWITRDTKSVDELVEERDSVALRLESAEVKLSKLANGERLKSLKGKKGETAAEPVVAAEGDAETGELWARWIPEKKRPTHKLGKFGLYGQKVDTITWCRSRLETLIPATDAAQVAYKSGEVPTVGGIFIEFAHQSDAQAAFQTLSHHQALHMSPRFIGINPNEIVWKSLNISWWQRVIRRFAVLGFITAMIVFWAIPVAFVGLISNISYLESYSFLHWLTKVPPSLMGVISGLLPSVMLAVLMSLVPVIMRVCAKLSGEPSLARVELFTQNAYFVFQVIQVFLVVTIGSSASTLVKAISKDPGATPQLLAEKIPQASNIYISYFIVQGLTIAAGVISQVVGFVIFKILYKYLAGTPRSMYTKWSNLSALSWGSILPVLTNIAVIGLVYSCIAPLILGFATIGLSFFYLAYRYNVLFVTDTQIDTKGLIYPRALQQLLVGVYIGEVLLIGLFGVAKSPAPTILMVIFLVFTALYHISLNAALDPLLYNLPKTLEAEEESHRLLAVEAGTPEHSELKEKDTGMVDSSVPPHAKPSMLQKFFKPHIYSDYATLRQLVPHSLLDPRSLYDEKTKTDAYFPPSVSAETPLLWIVKDEMGISKQEIAATSKVCPITDEGASFDEKNNVAWDPEGARPPLWTPKVYY